MTRQLLGCALAAGATVLLAVPAAAQSAELRLSQVRVDAGLRSAEVDVSVQHLPAGAGLDPASVTATAGDRSLPVSVSVSETSTTTSTPRVLLVVDTSGSMLGTPMAEAKQAISTFAAEAPAAVELGLMHFSTGPALLVEPTTDRTRLLGAVSSLQAQGETALYDAVLAGLDALGTTGDRRLVVLSDGGDTRSSADLAAALASAGSSGVVVDAIGFNTDESVGEVLTRLAGAGRGQVHRAASATELSAALATSAREHARALTVTALLPDDLRGDQSIEVAVSTPAGTLTAAREVAIGAATAVAVDPGWWGTRQALLVGLCAIGAGLLLGSLALTGRGRGDQRRVRSVLDRYTTAPRQEQSLRTSSPVTRTALAVAGKVATSRGLQDRLSLRLDRAAVALTPAEWLLLRAGMLVLSMLVLVLLGTHLVVALLLGGVIATVLPGLALKVRAARRQKAFEQQLPDALQMTAGSLSAGYSLAQALDGLVREGSEPMATEIGRALAESRLGVPVETTLDGVATRMDSRDFSWVIMAIRVQREVGGNLAGVLATVSATMRERAMLKRHVRGLSAEGRLSAYILLALPVFLALYMLTLRQEYVRPMYTTALGIAMVVLALVLLSIGSFWMTRMVKVEV